MPSKIKTPTYQEHAEYHRKIISVLLITLTILFGGAAFYYARKCHWV